MKRIIIGLLMTSAIAAGAFICFQITTGSFQAPTLSSPGRTVSQDTQGLAQLIRAANQHNDDTALSYHVGIQHADLDDFRAHLENIAKTKGWYPHGRWETDSVNHKNQRLVVPEDDLEDLRQIQQDPIRWVQDRRADLPGRSAPIDLVNVNLKIRAPVPTAPWAMVGVALLVIAGTIYLAATLAAVFSFLKGRRNQAKAADADAQADPQW